MLTLDELLRWSDESSRRWFSFLVANPQAQTLPCDIYGAANVLGLVRHIVAVELCYSQRLSGEPVTAYEEIPAGNLDRLVDLHGLAIKRFQQLLAGANQDWAAEVEFGTQTAGTLRASRRKILAHALLHGVRHWGQLAPLMRTAGFTTGIAGDLLLSSALA